MDTDETITLDARAQQRLAVLTHLLTGDLTLDEAAAVLRLSTRQVRRLAGSLERAEGAAALLHGNRGRRPANRLADNLRRRIASLATTTYAGFNPVHLAEALAEYEALEISPRTLRRILAAEKISLPRTRRPSRHRSRRERMPSEGMLLQADGSRDDWLEDRGPLLTLVGAIDDATGIVTGASFREQEDAVGYFAVCLETVHRYGLPQALYTDRHGIFVKDANRPPTLTEQLTGRRSFTQVGRALDEAGIGWLGAGSAQAKGRVERLWGTLQDRLKSELRKAGASTREEANDLLAWHLPRHNRQFTVPAASPDGAWRPWHLAVPPEAVFCFHYRRRVANDATLSFGGTALALPPRRDGRSWAGRAVIVEERLDGSLWVRHEGEHYSLQEAPAAAPLLRARHLDRLPLTDREPPPGRESPEPRPPSAHSVRRPPPDHPWRRPFRRRPR